MIDTLRRILLSIGRVYMELDALASQEEGDGGLTDQQVIDLRRETLKLYTTIDDATIHLHTMHRMKG